MRDVVHFRLDVPAADADVQVFDVAGRQVCSLLHTQAGPGRHVVAWDTRDAQGFAVPRGVYWVQARCGTFSVQRKVVVLR